MTYLNPRRATVVLYQGDDLDRLTELRRIKDAAERRAEADEPEVAARFGDDEPTEKTALPEQIAYDRAVDEARERALTVVIDTIGRTALRDLIAAHPPRRVQSRPGEDGATVEVDHPEDAGYEVNTSTFPEALLCYFDDSDPDGIVQTIAEPKFPTTAARTRFVNRELSDGDFERLWTLALLRNRTPSFNPKDLGYGSGSMTSDAT